MAKLGAVREGVMRADRITWTGHVRDTVLFSILKDEWQVTRACELAVPRIAIVSRTPTAFGSMSSVAVRAALACLPPRRAQSPSPGPSRPAKAGCSPSAAASRPRAQGRRRGQAATPPGAGGRLRSMMGTDHDDHQQQPRAYTYKAELIGADKPIAGRSCTLPANGRLPFEHWPQKADAVRISDFKVRPPGRQLPLGAAWPSSISTMPR